MALIVFAVGVLITGAATTSAFAQNTVTLPVEVYPSDGTSATVESVTIRATNGSQANRLYFQMHQPFYHRGGWETGTHQGFDPATMVDVRLNGGSWTTVRNSNVTCAYPESQYDCVGGPYSTIRFSVRTQDIGAAVNGVNTIDFRYNGTEGVRTGFRILHIGMMRPGDDINSFIPLPKAGATESLIDQTTFTRWDPSAWSAPNGYGDSQSVNQGEALWSAENTLQDIDGRSITASCASCHASDGRDLQYFSFSNKTIISRSKAHGLSDDEARKVAAYIRSQSFTLSNGSPAETNSPGTPWDPPYQPGPTGFGPNKDQHPDEADAFYWAAGAGLDWVLNHDGETLEYAFPASGDPANPGGLDVNADGSLNWARYRNVSKSEWGGNGGSDRGTALNMREIPLSVQLPDWNNWLPDIHPHDGLEKLFDGSQSEALFDNAESVFSSGSAANVRSFMDDANRLYYQDVRRDVKNSRNPSDGTDNPLTVTQWVHAINGGVQWRAVKIWYLNHRFGFENKADDLECDNSNDEWCEPLGWLGNVRAVFDVAPHVSGVDHNVPYVYGSGAANHFFSHAWYQLQMIVNPGTDGNNGQNPVDEGYQEAYLEQGCNAYNVPCGLRQTLSEWKFWQVLSNPTNGRTGLNGDDLTMDRVFAVLKTGDRKNKFWDRQTDTATGKRQAELLIEAFFRASNAYMLGENGSEGRLLTVGRDSGDGGKESFASLSYNPTYGSNHDEEDYSGAIYDAFTGNLYEQEYDLDDFFPNMSRGALDSLLAQGDFISPDDRDDGYAGEQTNGWPNQPRWHDLVDYTPPEIDGQTVQLQTGWNLVSTHVAPSTRSLDDIFSDAPEVILVKDERGQSYIPGFDINTIGPWRDHEAYYVYSTGPVDLTLTGSVIDATTQVDLEEGWNYVAYLPDGTMSPEEAFGSVSGPLVVAKDDAGNVYFPSDNIDGIGSLQPGEGYQLYLDQAATLEYPSAKSVPVTTTERNTGASRGLFSSANVVIPAAHGLEENQTVLALTGDDLPVGRGTVQNGAVVVTIRGNDPQTDVVDGARDGAQIDLYAMRNGEKVALDMTSARDAFSGTRMPDLTFAQNGLIIGELASVPERIKLHGSYPNPARSSATVRYELPSQSDVRITLYNSLGQRVARIFDGEMRPGTHTLPVDVSQFASGMYFVRLQVGETTEVQRMAVVK